MLGVKAAESNVVPTSRQTETMKPKNPQREPVTDFHMAFP